MRLDGASTKSTCPAISATARVVASGIGISTSRSCFGTRAGFHRRRSRPAPGARAAPHGRICRDPCRRRLGILRVVDVGLLDHALRDHVPDAQIVRRAASPGFRQIATVPSSIFSASSTLTVRPRWRAYWTRSKPSVLSSRDAGCSRPPGRPHHGAVELHALANSMIHRLLLAGSNRPFVARPGVSSASRSKQDRSQLMSAS